MNTQPLHERTKPDGSPLLVRPNGDSYEWCVLLIDSNGETTVEWHSTRTEAVDAATEFKADAMDSGDPVDVYVLHVDVQS